MAVPSFDSLMLPVLETLVDGKIHRPREVNDKVAAQLGVSAEDQAEMLPSGAMPRFRNRVLWALHYMKRAGLIASPSRGQYVIADSGRALLAEAPAKITTKTLERYPGYREFMGHVSPKPQDPEELDTDVATPEERLLAAYEEVRDHLAVEVLERLRAVDPLRFERIVLEVLTAMGYGGSDPERATITARSHDGGLDGVIKEDTLGLDQVVVQAKRYNSPVDVKLVREFAGSLDEHGTDKGVFFTTDKFTGPAMDFARSIKKRIILIDGPELARLMVRHQVGVTVTKTLPLARLDSDYFDSGMEA
jgi:restriction system protein